MNPEEEVDDLYASNTAAQEAEDMNNFIETVVDAKEAQTEIQLI